MKNNVGIIGSASQNISDELKCAAIDMGRAVVDAGFRVVNGGMGGVMKYSAQGAHQSPCYKSGDVIGILPSYKKSEANEYIDIIIPTGIGVARNAIVISASDIVIALDGGAGTLSELAMAWQMKKSIVCYGKKGWHDKIKDLELDSRGRESMKVIDNILELKLFLENCPNVDSGFTGIEAPQSFLKKEIIH